jgi:hypothetical protein
MNIRGNITKLILERCLRVTATRDSAQNVTRAKLLGCSPQAKSDYVNFPHGLQRTGRGILWKAGAAERGNIRIRRVEHDKDATLCMLSIRLGKTA